MSLTLMSKTDYGLYRRSVLGLYTRKCPSIGVPKRRIRRGPPRVRISSRFFRFAKCFNMAVIEFHSVSTFIIVGSNCRP